MKIQTLAITLAAACAVPAAANVELRQRSVRYNDLDLTTETGRKTLDRRLDTAARDVCGMDQSRVGSHIAPAEARRCYREARGRLDERIAALTSRAAPGA